MRILILCLFVSCSSICSAKISCTYFDGKGKARNACGCNETSGDYNGSANIIFYEDQYAGTKPFKDWCEGPHGRVSGCDKDDLQEIGDEQLENPKLYEENQP